MRLERRLAACKAEKAVLVGTDLLDVDVVETGSSNSSIAFRLRSGSGSQKTVSDTPAGSGWVFVVCEAGSPGRSQPWQRTRSSPRGRSRKRPCHRRRPRLLCPIPTCPRGSLRRPTLRTNPRLRHSRRSRGARTRRVERSDMADKPLQGKRIAFLATDGVEQVELTEPWKAVEEAGAEPVLVSPKDGQVQGFRHLDRGDTFDVHESVAETSADRFDGLVLPGGVANPDQLRMDEKAVAFVRSFVES